MTGNIMGEKTKGDEVLRKSTGKKRKLHLTVRGVQTAFGQEDISEICVPGEYFRKGDVHYVFYSEHTEEGLVLKNRLTITPEKVELRKTGNGSSILLFRQGSTESCRYQSPAGMLNLTSDTKKIKFRCGEQDFHLTLKYSFYMTGLLMSDYHLTVRGIFRD
ncbi:MAG: DUF1934 domain-containing protein [Eubacteriales bacterium]|nr:DUF1934 domain-containing protein [Eubacteriales bacterium]